MNIKQLSRSLLSAAVVSAVSLACTNGLRDYTQITMQVTDTQASVQQESEKNAEEDTEKNTAETKTDPLAKAQTALEKRLASLNLDTAEVTVAEPDQVIVRLPRTIDAEQITSSLLKPSQLTLQNQKPETEDQLAENIEILQRLLIDQNTLIQTNKQAEANALQPQVDETRTTILSLFDPGDINSTMVLDAQAVQLTGFNVWEVHIWFDSQGANQFTEQTKAIAGTGRTIGIFLDNVLLSTPTVDIQYAETGVPGGEAIISGNFTAEAAKDLARQLKNGALPVELDIISVTSSDEPDEPTVEDPEEEVKQEEEPAVES